MVTNEEKANLIVKQLEDFSKKHLEVEIKGIEKYPELVEIFLTGAWYGAVKAFESNKLNIVKE